MKYKKVIFCSRDCTYRAPVAAEIFKHAVREIIPELENEVYAKGMVVMFEEPVNGKALAIGISKGYSLEEYRAQPIVKSDFHVDTLILVMTDKDKKEIYELYDNAINVYTIKEFVKGAGDVDVPFGGNLANYGESFNQIESLVMEVVDRIMQIK